MVSKKSTAKAKDTVQDAAPETVINKAATLASETKRTNNMSDVSSIVEFSEDISNAEAIPPLPEGDYPAEIRSAVRKTSNTSGKDYAQVQFFIAPESYPADYTDGDPDGTLLTFNRVSLEDAPASRHRLRKFVEAIGAKGGSKIDLNDWQGLTATVAIAHGEWEGEKRAEVRKVIAA